MVGWHHQLNGCEFEQIQGESGRQGGLACCTPWSQRVRHDLATEPQQHSRSVGFELGTFPTQQDVSREQRNEVTNMKCVVCASGSAQDSGLHHLTTCDATIRYPTCLSLGYLICRMELIIVPTPQAIGRSK